MKEKSLANPRAYKEKTEIYDIFSKAEDYLKKIEKFIIPRIDKKIVLDLGCGGGKFSKILSKNSLKYFGLDISKEQLQFAKRTVKESAKIKFIQSSAEKIPLLSKSVDIVFAAWSLSVVNGFKRKKKVLREIQRVLKENGKIFIVENDFNGEFERLRGHPKRTKKYNSWLKKQGFKEEKVKTYFRFKSLNEAQQIFEKIWGNAISNKIKSRVIEHRVVIFSKIKPASY